MKILDRVQAYTLSDDVKAQNVYPFFRPVEKTVGNHAIIKGHKKLLACSNDYLSLTSHPKVIKAAQDALTEHGTACSGSRFLNGNTILHDQLEEELADFLGYDDCAVMSTGYLANVGGVGALSTRKTVIFSDKENHASIVDACQFTMATVKRYAHNDMEALESLLQKYQDVSEKIIISDGVFSMTGVIVDLPKLIDMAQKYDAFVYIDDAHALGAIGASGKGTGEHFSQKDDIHLTMGTFSKTLASIGGYVASSKEVIRYVRHHARAIIFSASIPASSAASALTALTILKSEPERVTTLQDTVAYARKCFTQAGFNIGPTQGPIIPVIMEGGLEVSFLFTQKLFEAGIFAAPVLPPAVPAGTTLIRTSYMYGHSKQDVDQIVDAFVAVRQSMLDMQDGKAEQLAAV